MKSNWQPLFTQFRQGWDGAYGYVDKCGEFMSKLREKFAFYPGGVTPTECKLDLPESHLTMTASPAELNLFQQGPQWGKSEKDLFVEIAQYSTELGAELFKPFEVYRNGLSQKLITYETTLAKARALSLEIWGGEDQVKLGNQLSLQTLSKEVKFTFASGSYELDVHLEPVTIGLKKREHNLPQPRSSKAQSDYFSRVNQANSKPLIEPGYVLMLTLDLMEVNPAPGSVPDLLKLLEKYKETLLKDLS